MPKIYIYWWNRAQKLPHLCAPALARLGGPRAVKSPLQNRGGVQRNRRPKHDLEFEFCKTDNTKLFKWYEELKSRKESTSNDQKLDFILYRVDWYPIGWDVGFDQYYCRIPTTISLEPEIYSWTSRYSIKSRFWSMLVDSFLDLGFS